MLDTVTTAGRGGGRIARNRLRIAWMYYVEGLTQNEIADRLGIGRVTVVRNIGECLDLEHQLKDAFKLIDAVVVPEPGDPANTAKAIGVAAGMYTTDSLADGMAIGVGWGATLYASLQTLAPRDIKGAQVVSLLGGIVQARLFNPSEFAWRFAQSVGADCYLLAAPAIVDSPETKAALIERCGLSDVLGRAERVDMALLSVGTMAANSTTFRFGFFSEADRAALIRLGAVGDILYNFHDRAGRLVDHPINGRVMSIPIDKLRGVAKRVIASGGDDKVDALLGAIALIGCNVLITDEATARQLLRRKS
jgi:DNA-binding transcriptional regulator LsrR (DeoR family)